MLYNSLVIAYFLSAAFCYLAGSGLSILRVKRAISRGDEIHWSKVVFSTFIDILLSLTPIVNLVSAIIYFLILEEEY